MEFYRYRTEFDLNHIKFTKGLEKNTISLFLPIFKADARVEDLKI
jgi:hypothetical protein